MSIQHKDTKYADRKSSRCEMIKKEAQPSFKPKINQTSREIDKSINSHEINQKRIEYMYSYAEKYDNHKVELREKYRDVE